MWNNRRWGEVEYKSWKAYSYPNSLSILRKKASKLSDKKSQSDLFGWMPTQNITAVVCMVLFFIKNTYGWIKKMMMMNACVFKRKWPGYWIGYTRNKIENKKHIMLVCWSATAVINTLASIIQLGSHFYFEETLARLCSAIERWEWRKMW